jgi:hypothetical protein
MAQKVWKDIRLLLDGLDLSGDANAFSFVHASEVQDATPMNVSGRKRQGQGLISTDFAHEGFWNSNGVDGLDEVLYGKIGMANALMSIFPETLAEGALVYFVAGIAGEYSFLGSIGEMNRFALSGQSSHGDGLLRGSALHYATRTTSGNGSALDLGAVGAAQRLYAGLHVIDGTGTLDVKIQSDAAGGFGSPLDQVTFPQQVGKAGVYAASVAGPNTDSFWRASWTIGGATPSFTFAVVMAIR